MYTMPCRYVPGTLPIPVGHDKYTQYIANCWTSFWSPIGSRQELKAKFDHLSHGIAFRVYLKFSKVCKNIQF